MTSDSPSTTGPGRLPEQRTAVITGAGGPAGIGRVTARILAENGWHVALVDINADGLAAVEAATPVIRASWRCRPTSPPRPR